MRVPICILRAIREHHPAQTFISMAWRWLCSVTTRLCDLRFGICETIVHASRFHVSGRSKIVRFAIAAWVTKVTDAITEKSVTDRFRNIGGIPRIIFGEEEAMSLHLDSRKRQLQDAGMIAEVVTGTPLDNFGPRIPTYLFAYKSPASDNFKQRSVDFVSEGARNAIFETHYTMTMAILADPNKHPSVRGFKFEEFCGWLLTDGARALQWEDRELPCEMEVLGTEANSRVWQTQEPGFVLPQHPLSICDTEPLMDAKWQETVQGQQRGFVLRTPKDYTGIDYLVGFNSGVQATISRTHDIAPKLYEKLRAVGLPRAEFTLFFFVPSKVFDSFKVDGRSGRGVKIVKVRIPMTPDSV